ncbi:hypothetical protein PF005_g8540 [Phytophthora fragariae]|uniref:Uncharacterized protein n=2 Tax=Phytophthora TaxID=4783 RepID=A0A6A3FAE5_9STRA|nr:hypothetical protein PF003_g10349 [Phytophthora fragariae]KAE9033581.1 hypothetical protein PR002_g8598 [Phytophthora rubi]KAE8940810.1 hypothetical protein PF009_g9399 [Phytophthora fragariae]KAE9012923.1 hypothetical protein PF011_g8706 [Phytophthora fragariae]KAE9071934.1 hypothetical protein PF007_g26360 [Phytophthora fragariae]
MRSVIVRFILLATPFCPGVYLMLGEHVMPYCVLQMPPVLCTPLHYPSVGPSCAH